MTDQGKARLRVLLSRWLLVSGLMWAVAYLAGVSDGLPGTVSVLSRWLGQGWRLGVGLLSLSASRGYRPSLDVAALSAVLWYEPALGTLSRGEPWALPAVYLGLALSGSLLTLALWRAERRVRSAG